METREATTGGVIMLGNHVIKHWSSTQALIALSPGEAEHCGCVRAGSHALGLRSMLAPLGVTGKRLRIKTDASLAKSLASRRGLGAIRQMNMKQLWLQDKVNKGETEILKIMGIINKADALTKPNDEGSIKQHLQCTSQEITTGRLEFKARLTQVNPLERSCGDNLEQEYFQILLNKSSSACLNRVSSL